MAMIGNLRECSAEITFEWEIMDFFSLSKEKDIHYESPKFYFSGASWQVSLYPNREETECKSDDCIGMYIVRKSTGTPVSVSFSLCLKTAGGKKEQVISSTAVFDNTNCALGYSKFISRSVLLEKKSELTPSDVLTVICNLKNSEPNNVNGSLFSRLQAVSDNLSEIYFKAKKADLILKTDDRKLPAHRMILETRSPVFAAMLRHNTKENQTGQVCVEDVASSTMNSLLLHIYSGDIDTLTCENALSLYAAAEKYDIKTVREMCSEFIIRNLSVEWVLDVIKFAELYQDEVLGDRSKEYFEENADKILETANWDNFVKENHGISVELLATVVKTMFKK